MNAERRIQCLVAGDANLDLLLEGEDPPIPCTEVLAKRMQLVLGGSSSITASNLASLGVRTAFAGVVGDDLFGDLTAKALRRAGVQTRLLRRRQQVNTGLTTWIINRKGRSGITYAGSIALLRAEDIRDKDLAAARHFHVGAYFLLTGLHSGAANLFSRAKAAGCTTSLDCNYDPTGKWDSGLHDVLPFVDLFLPNEAEACKIARSKSLKAASIALARRAKLVVIKRGAQGALWCEGARVHELPAKRIKAVDTTGAGDSFNAGFLSRFIAGAPVSDCVRFGITVAARSVQFYGGTGATLHAPS